MTFNFFFYFCWSVFKLISGNMIKYVHYEITISEEKFQNDQGKLGPQISSLRSII